MNAKAYQNCETLVKAGIATLQAMGMSEDRIILYLPYLATEAVAFLAKKAAH